MDDFIYSRITFPCKIFVDGFVDSMIDRYQHARYTTLYGVYHEDTAKICTQEFINFIQSCDLDLVEESLTFVCSPGHKGFLHKDVHPVPEWNGKYKFVSLNVNIGEYPGTLSWYHTDQNGTIKYTEANTPYETWQENSEPLAIYHDYDTILMRTDIAHIGKNMATDKIRITQTFSFTWNPDWRHVVKKLESYLIK